MPLKNSSGPPPKVMTWKEASPALIAAGLCDALRAFFNLFWFFGPAIAAFYCTTAASEWIGEAWGLTKAVCAMAATAGGVYFSPVIASFGVVMADAVAFMGFLALVFWILIANSRMIKTVTTAYRQISASFLIGALPIIGAFPTFAPTVWKLYRRQIKLERAAYKKWEQDTAAARQQQRDMQIAQAVRLRTSDQLQAQQMQVAQQEAAIYPPTSG